MSVSHPEPESASPRTPTAASPAPAIAPSDAHSLGDALSYEAALSISWAPLPAPLEPLKRDSLADDNLRVLSAVALLDEQRGSSAGSEDGSPLDAEIVRLNQKLNLLIDLLGFLVNQQAPAADAQRVRLSWQGVVFRGEAAVGDIGLVSIRLNRSVPQPLVWPARIVHASGDERHARFEPFSDPVQTALERHVFLHHRRAVAVTRRSPGG